MSQSSACSSSFHHSPGLAVPPCDIPHIQISNTEMEGPNLGIPNEDVFDPGKDNPSRNYPWNISLVDINMLYFLYKICHIEYIHFTYSLLKQDIWDMIWYDIWAYFIYEMT